MMTSFKYIVAIMSDNDENSEVIARIIQVTAALTKLKPIKRDSNIPLGLEIKLMRFPLIFISACL